MARTSPLDSAAVVKELKGVAAKLGDGSSRGRERLALLRRQAQLGDVRDAIDERVRRRAPERPRRAPDGR